MLSNLRNSVGDDRKAPSNSPILLLHVQSSVVDLIGRQSFQMLGSTKVPHPPNLTHPLLRPCGSITCRWSQIFSSRCPILTASRIGVRRRSTTFTVRRCHRSGSRCAPARRIASDAAESSRARRAAARRTERRARSPPSSKAE